MGLLDFDPQKNPLIGKLPLPGVPMGMPAPKQQPMSDAPSQGNWGQPKIATPSEVAPKVAPVNLPPPVSPTTQADMNEAARIKNTGSGIHQLSQSHPILGGIAKVADTIGGALLPGLTARIPGTEMHHNVVQHQADARVNADVQNDERLAQGNEANARADAILHPPQKEPTTAFELWHQQNPQGTYEQWQALQQKEAPEVNSPQAGYARAIADAIANGRDPVSDPHVMAWKQAIDDSAKTKEPNKDDRYIAIQSKPQEQWTPEERAFVQGYEKFVKTSKTDPGVARVTVQNEPRWAGIDIQKQKMVAPYVEKAMDAAKIDDLAERIMNDVRSRGGQITGPEFMQLLSYHMAGTLGSVKGGRIGEEMIREHINARPWSESLQAMYNKAVNGGNVSLQQAQEWAKLAQDRRRVMVDQAHQANDLYGAGLDENKMPGYGQSQPPAGSRPVIVNGKTVGYTTDGKTMTPVNQ